MGDGGVAFAPSQHVVERFPIPETFCGAYAFQPEPTRMKHGEQQQQHPERGGSEKSRRREERVKRGELEKGQFLPERRRRGEQEKGDSRNGELEKGEFTPEQLRKGDLEKGEFVPEKSRKELEKGEFVPEKWRTDGELEKGEFVPGKSRRGELEKGEFVPDKGRKGGELEKGEFVPDKGRRGDGNRGRKVEMEKGEFLPDRWRKSERERDRERERSPEESYRRKDGGRCDYDHRKRPGLKWEGNFRERDQKNGSRTSEEEPGEIKYEHSNGKSHSKEHSLGSWSKRHRLDSENSNRKHHGDTTDHSGFKSRRLSDENNQNKYPERLGRNASSSSSKASIVSKQSSMHHESSQSSRTSQNKQGQSPIHSERSPHERGRRHDSRDRSPGHLERSPHDRNSQFDHRDRGSGHSDRSPRERARHHDHRDRTPGLLERSPHDRGRALDPRDQSRKIGGVEKQPYNRYEERFDRRESFGKDTHKNSSVRQLNDSSSCPDKACDGISNEEKGNSISWKEPGELPPPPPHPPFPPSPQLQVSGNIDDQPSMEEDMDICDTPPHDSTIADLNLGKWYYLDHFGMEQGPSKLVDLKRLVENGVLLSDHMIKHADTDCWVTVENAASPLVSLHASSIVSDAVTQMVSPPDAPGNLLIDAGDVSEDTPISTLQKELHHDDSSISPKQTVDFHFDERVEALLNGYRIVDGKELEIIGEALNATFKHAEWETWGQSEGFTRSRSRAYELSIRSRDEETGRVLEASSKEVAEIRPSAPSEECFFLNGNSTDWFADRWSCMGGDWKRNEEAVQDRFSKRRHVLCEGYPLCQMPKNGCEDPRWHRRENLYYSSRKKLDLPSWAFAWAEDKNDNSNDANKSLPVGRLNQVKPAASRGVKGIVLPVIRINACVVKDQGSSEPRTRKSSERPTPRSSRSYHGEGSLQSRKLHDQDLKSLHKCRTILNTPKDHVCSVDELSLHLGDWYYLDGAGHEHGPSTYKELQDLAAKGTIMKNCSVFRKDDNIWLPVTANSEAVHCHKERVFPQEMSSDPLLQMQICKNDSSRSNLSFHSLHPQFIGYMRGKLHELVMRSYKNREFAAAVNEVLDPWMCAKQPKKDLDKHYSFSSSIAKTSAALAHDLSAEKFWKSEDGISGVCRDSSRSGKRARIFCEGSDGDYDEEEDALCNQLNDCSFEDLFVGSAFVDDNCRTHQADNESWGLLNARILARVFHYLRADMKSLIFSAGTCKQWNLAVKGYKNISRHVDFSAAGPSCTDSMFRIVMSGYDTKNIKSIGLAGCSDISAGALEEILQLFPCISTIDIRGCNQFKDLQSKIQDMKWLRGFSSCYAKNFEESGSKIRSLKQITEKNYQSSKLSGGSSSHFDDSMETLGFDSHEYYMNRKDSSSQPFWQGHYKRAKLDAKKSSAVISRDAWMRQLLRKKSEYRKMEEIIASRLKDIMKANTFEFFIAKVAEIEDRMRSGYYFRRGLDYVKDDIRRMCRDALKQRNRADAGDMNQIVMQFIHLVNILDENPKSSSRRDEMLKALKDDSDAGSNLSVSKYGKKHNRALVEKRGMNRSSSTSYSNGAIDYGGHVFDREKSLSKSSRRGMDSGSESSDDHDNDLLDEVKGQGESTDSDTESDLEFRSGRVRDVKGDEYGMMDESFDSVGDDREWGARMTKASLVPPVARKYEVIDKYLIIADEEDVRRKMQVALPDDYEEKHIAQKAGIEESEMEIPEVKDYSPRKVLGEEVLEQEVYGIDPYTHNLLLDSMPEEPEWQLVDKHKFIEEVLLRSLNKQVRHFTGTGNAPMVYPLQPVVEEIQKTAEMEGNLRIVKVCHAILKAIHGRPDDNYVAYRKGIGVVCNKKDGFAEDDFVVEFLGEVYPAWKWFEKQDGVRSLQKDNKEPAPEFYNIYLERPKGDRDGYDLVVVDAMHKANYASRICHSCRPNCEAKVTAVDGQYQIGIYTLRPIGYGEEITFDYNSVTESKEEYEASVCLCGNQVCRGSYLNLAGDGAFQKVLKESHGILDRHRMMLEACETSSVSHDDYADLGRAGLGTCLLSGLPDWLVAYSAHLVRFINFERTKLPEEIMKHNVEEKRKFFSDICLEVEKSDAEVQAEGVYNARLQNMALTLDKVRYVMRCVFGDPKKAPPPLQKLSPRDLVFFLWKGEGSLIEELLQCMAPHVDADMLNDLKSKIHAHDPSEADDLRKELRKSLLWLRDELRNLPCTYKCRHDAAADLIHMYAYTRCFFKVQEYKSVKSPPVYISPLDLGPKYADKMGSGFHEYCKTYGEKYCLGQLIFWHSQSNADPDSNLARGTRGCLSLPDVASFYAKSQKPLREHVYGSRTVRFMLSRMAKQPERPWPKDQIWVFKNNPKIFGSPMLDAMLNKSPLDKEMMHWLKSRPAIFQGSWDG